MNLITETIGDFPKTANETIDSIYFNDQKMGIKRDGWKFYVHLNKDFSPLERKGFIKCVGTKTGPTGKSEKIWAIVKPADWNESALKAS